MDALIQGLIDDAIRVADYGLRAGLFNDRTLFDAVNKAKAKGKALAWKSPEVTHLQKALNDAVRAIAPVTLVELKGGWDPYAAGSRKSELVKWLCVAASVVLIVVCAYYTLWHRRATDILNGASAAIAAEQKSLIDDITFAMMTQAADAGTGEQDAAALIAFLKDVYRVRDLEASITQFNQDVQLLREQSIIGRRQALRVLTFVSRQGTANAAVPESAVATCTPPSTDPGTFSNSPGTVLETDKMREYTGCILRASGVPPAQWKDIHAIKQAVDLIALWWLPGFYGMLGSIVFYMRSFLHPMRPDPSLPKVILRVALGGFAGIAVAWFWSPAFNTAMSVPNVSFGTLTLAFLFGFSIEVFFAFLDRLVNLANDSVNRLGSS